MVVQGSRFHLYPNHCVNKTATNHVSTTVALQAMQILTFAIAAKARAWKGVIGRLMSLGTRYGSTSRLMQDANARHASG